MRALFTFLAAVVLTISVFAQSPEKMSYQAVIRNSNDQLVTDQGIGMQVSILQGTADGTPVYVETHSATTNANGLVTIEIGTGTTTNDFSSIDWSNGTYFIKIETDPTTAGGTNYTIAGISQLLSVPYALHAKTAESIEGGITETDPVFTAWDKSTGISITESQISDLGTYLESETDPVFGASVASGIKQADTAKWNAAAGGTLTETDPVFTAWDKDYTDIINTPTDVSTFTNDAGYLTAEVDGSITNEIELPTQSGQSGKILSTDGSNPQWVADDVLTETEVDDYVSDNGYLTEEVDGSVTNEIELPSQSGNAGRYLTTDGSSPSWATISAGASQLSDLSDVNTATTTSGNILVADGTDFESVAVSGDATFSSNGTLTITDNSVDGSDIALGSDAAGDVMYYDGTNWIRLPKGTDGQVLTLSSGVPSWQDASGGSSDPVYGFAHLTTAGTASTSEVRFGGHTSAVVTSTVSSTGITWDDTNKEFDITTTGVYEIIASGAFTSISGSEYGEIRLYSGGSQRVLLTALSSFADWNGNAFVVRWIGTITSGSSVYVTLDETANSATFDIGSAITVKKID